MDSREHGHDAFYRLPKTSWTDVDDDARAELGALSQSLADAVEQLDRPDDATLPPPGLLAARMMALGNRLLSAVNAEEFDLRQVITTLRTALTVCWDMYGIEESERTTVRQHMNRLREQIESFEADLVALRAEPGSD